MFELQTPTHLAARLTLACLFFKLILATDRCIPLKEKIQQEIVSSLETQGAFQVQSGSVEFTLVGSDDVVDCEQKDCAYSNPKSPYGLVTLPLSPKEDLTKKLDGTYDLPAWSVSNLDGSQGWDYGLSPSWQLRQDEVVMVFGCTPPASSSRYFGATGYIYDMFSVKDEEWISVFGSLGDTKSIIREVDQLFGFENRLKTSAFQPDNFFLTADKEEIGAQESAYEKLTLTLMGASRGSIQRSQRAIDAVLQRHGLEGIVNVIGIPREFGKIGLTDEDDSHHSYYTMLLRNTIAVGGMANFEKYLSQMPLSAWRMTPIVENTTPPTSSDEFSVEQSAVIPRSPTTQPPMTEDALALGLEKLIEKVEERYIRENVVAHAFGAAPSLALMDLEWGLDCVVRETDFCNGDNRDALYVSTYPLFKLDTSDRFAYIVGVNHREAGMTMYNNVAITEPIKRMGVASVDDEEIYGSAETFLRGTEFEDSHQYYYAIRVARDCTGVDFCTTIAAEGGRSVPLDTKMLVVQRLYVNPQTGVGPDGDNVLMPHTMVFTPSTTENADDYKRDRIDPDVVNNSPCMVSFVKLTTCAKGIGEACCNAVTTWTNNGCFCDDVIGEPLMRTLPENFGVKEFKGLSLLCGAIPLCDVSIRKMDG